MKTTRRYKMKYKVGQKVKIRKDLIRYTRYDNLCFVPGMEKYCGTIQPITGITDDGHYEINDFKWVFSDAMIEGLADCITSPERIQPISTRPEPSRLEIAAMAMKGILGSGTYKGTPNQLSFLCTEYADALIKECKGTKGEDKQ